MNARLPDVPEPVPVGDIVTTYLNGSAARFLSVPTEGEAPHQIVTRRGFFLGRIFYADHPTTPFEVRSWDDSRSARVYSEDQACAWLFENETGAWGGFGLWK